jgi:peptide/nickel transport system permease protein
MTRFIVMRLIQTVIALFGIMFLVFVVVRLTGDPSDLLRTPTTTPEQLTVMRHQFGLDRSLIVQFGIYSKNLLTGDLGTSYIKHRTVVAMIGDALPNTVKLSGFAFIVGMGLALLLGVLAAVRRDTIYDQGVKFLAILGQALPGFWLAIMAILVFSVDWPILPAGGQNNGALSYVLPVGTMAFFLLPGMMRLIRSSMLDILDSEYIKLARIKGLPERVIIWKHALRNALIAPLTIAGMLIAMMITGAVITEQIFNWPGMGKLMLDAVTARDFPVVQSLVLFVAAVVLLVNLLVDVLYAYIDPQIRYQKS